MRTYNGGLFVGCIGGVVSILGMALFYLHEQSTVTTFGILLLLAAMFFGAAGGFTKYSQWTPKALTVYTFIVAAIAIIATVGEIFDIIFGAVEIIIAIILVILAYVRIPKIA